MVYVNDVSSSDCLAFNEIGRLFGVIFWGVCLDGKHENLQPRKSVSGPKSKTKTSQSRSRSTANLNTTLITRCRNSEGIVTYLRRRGNLTSPNVSRLSGYFILRMSWCSLLCLTRLRFIPGVTFTSSQALYICKGTGYHGIIERSASLIW